MPNIESNLLNEVFPSTMSSDYMFKMYGNKPNIIDNKSGKTGNKH